MKVENRILRLLKNKGEMSLYEINKYVAISYSTLVFALFRLLVDNKIKVRVDEDKITYRKRYMIRLNKEVRSYESKGSTGKK